MNSITINIKKQAIKNKIEDFLKTFNNEELEIIETEDYADLKPIKNIRSEETAYLMSSEANKKRILDSLNEIEAGGGINKEIIEL